MSGRNTSKEMAVGTEFAGQRQGFRAGSGSEDLEPFVAGQVTEHASVMRVVFYDQ